MPSLMRLINVISRCQSLYRAEQLADCSLLACHHTFLYAIHRMPGCSQDALARHLCLNKSTVARAIAKMEEEGFVTRVPDKEDKRVMLVYLTDKARELLPRVRAVSAAWRDALSTDISKEEMQVFDSVLERMAPKAKILAGIEEKGDGAK